MHSCKNDPCADVSQKYRKIYLMDEMPGWFQNDIQTDDDLNAASLMSKLIQLHSVLDIRTRTKDK